MDAPTAAPVVLVVAPAGTGRAAELHRLVALAGARPSDALAAGEQPAAVAMVADLATLPELPRSDRSGRPPLLVVGGSEPDAASWRAAVAAGATEVCVLPRDEQRVLDWLVATITPPRDGDIVCCLPGRGGAGASTLAAAAALCAAPHARVLLLDGDAAGGGLDLLIGAEALSGARWPQVTRDLPPDLPSVGGVAVLSAVAGDPRPIAAELAATALAAVRTFDLVVVDLGPGGAETVLELGGRVRLVVVVVPAEVRAVAATRAVTQRLLQRQRDVVLVVRAPGPGGLRAAHVAQVVGVPALAVWRWQGWLGRLVDDGDFAHRWSRTAVAGPAAAVVARVRGLPTA